MRKAVLKGATIGLSFSGVAYIAVKLLGYRWVSLSILMYLYVVMGVLMAVGASIDIFDRGFSSLLHSVVIVVEGEEMELKKLATGEKYRVKGALEKI